MKQHVRFLPILLLLLAGCAEPAEDTLPLAETTAPADNTVRGTVARPPDEARIDAVYERFSQAYDEWDTQAMVDLYTDDALYLSGDGAIRRGRAAIEESFSFLQRVKDRGETVSISFRLIDRAIEGDLAYDVGYYQTISTPADGEPRTSVGKFITVLKKQTDGSWRFQVDGYNSAPVDAFEQAPSE